MTMGLGVGINVGKCGGGGFGQMLMGGKVRGWGLI